MRFIDFPEIHFVVQGIDDVVLPRMVRIREQYEKDKIEDIRAHLNAKLDLTVQDKSWYQGKSIAITVGSRGIPDLPLMVRTICDRLKSWGADPFIVPAMGSHGRGCVEGNLEILSGYGITEESIGVPIRAGMEVVRIGELPDDAHTPVYCDRFAAEADGIVLFNKVKPHTDFKGYHESGLCKMMAIGLAKHKGASWFHKQGFDTFAERVPLVADVFLKNTNVVFGVGVVQNAYDDISEIEVFPADQIREGDHRLLEIARRRLPKMKFDNIDVLIIDRIGKEISGAGADPNVTGRGFMPYFDDDFHCKKLFIRGISELSHHNACGLGLADITTRRCLNQVDWESTWINLSTSLMIQGGKIPMYQNNDYDALRLALRTCPRLNDYSGARIARIKNTLSLGEVEVSEPIYEEIRNRSDIEAVGDPYELSFDENGNLEDLQ